MFCQPDDTRREDAYTIRVEAAKIARDREHPTHVSNGEEAEYSYATEDDCSMSTYISCFTKGLPHDRNTGLLLNPEVYDTFREAIATGDSETIQSLPLGAPEDEGFSSGISRSLNKDVKPRAWESMAAGLIFDLEGPDSHAVTIPPAPRLNSNELVFEMTELYWMALLRDINFNDFECNQLVLQAINCLNNTLWICQDDENIENLYEYERNRLRCKFTTQNIFRGVLKGDDIGPYISQFLLRGSTGIGGIFSAQDGKLQFGANIIDQKVRIAHYGKDYMTTWGAWIDVQNGADLRGYTGHVQDSEEDKFRFITTPRDLATYVHFDALYQAYLNACLFLLAIKVPYDPSLPFVDDDSDDKQQGFAHFGGPHVLCLVTEVCTRVLHAIRYQKFNTHRRLRPEALGGLLERIQYCEEDEQDGIFEPVRSLYNEMDKELLELIKLHNCKQNEDYDGEYARSEDYSPIGENKETLLLPMAYSEGSPMHPSYGAGHAAVAGACITILKAFFDHNYQLEETFIASNDGKNLQLIELDEKLTVEGELNKLCSNISIGRNWAGVHYYSDYIESVRLGEKIALGILEEQKITYGEKFHMTIPLLDGTTIEM